MMWVTSPPERFLGASPFLPQESMELGSSALLSVGFTLAIHLGVGSEGSGAEAVLFPEVAYS